MRKTVFFSILMSSLFNLSTATAYQAIFHARLFFEAGYEPSSVAIADFNGDSHPDLAVANAGNYPQPGSISVLLGKGDGTFTTAANYGVGKSPDSVAVGDLNGDGHFDLVVANGGSSEAEPPDTGNVSVLFGNGDGSFQAAVDYGAGWWPRSVGIGDLNGDTHPDLAVANGNGVSVLPGNGDGTFQEAVNCEVSPNP